MFDVSGCVVKGYVVLVDKNNEGYEFYVDFCYDDLLKIEDVIKNKFSDFGFSSIRNLNLKLKRIEF